MPDRAVALAVAALLLSAAFAAGCSSNDGKTGATPTLTATTSTPAVDATSTPAGVRATPTPAPDIKQQDFSKEPSVALYVETSGGSVDSSAIIYADLTQDGVDDAVIPIASGGEGGNIAVFVFGYGEEGLLELLRVAPAQKPIAARVANGRLQVDEPVFAPGDPMCCPSQLQRTTYTWDGSELSFDSQEVVPSGT